MHPAYPGYSLVNIPPTICHLLGCSPSGRKTLSYTYLDGLKHCYKHIVLLLVDGLGYDMLMNMLDMPSAQVYRERAVITPMTSLCPSTTAAAITTLWTGATAAEHGVLGYEVYLREYGLIANMIFHNPASFSGAPGALSMAGMDPIEFLPVKTLGEHYRANKLEVCALQPANIINSGLSTMLFHDVHQTGYSNISDLWATLTDLSEATRNQRSYIYAYFPNLDELGHRFSPDDDRVRQEFELFTQGLTRYLDSLPRNGDTLVLLIADHGMKTTPIRSDYNIHQMRQIKKDIVMYPSGENRLAYFYAKADKLESLYEKLTNLFPGELTVLNAEQAVRSGLFGPGEPYRRTWDRVGDLITVSNGDAYIWWAAKKNRMRGRHGGLSREEMLIPFVRFEV